MLNTERNTPSMEKKVKASFRKSSSGYRFGLIGETRPKLARKRRVSADFEHGQWFITDLDTGAQWSVCDAYCGFVFEQVSEGEDL